MIDIVKLLAGHPASSPELPEKYKGSDKLANLMRAIEAMLDFYPPGAIGDFLMKRFYLQAYDYTGLTSEQAIVLFRCNWKFPSYFETIRALLVIDLDQTRNYGFFDSWEYLSKGCTHTAMEYFVNNANCRQLRAMMGIGYHLPIFDSAMKEERFKKRLGRFNATYLLLLTWMFEGGYMRADEAMLAKQWRFFLMLPKFPYDLQVKICYLAYGLQGYGILQDAMDEAIAEVMREI